MTNNIIWKIIDVSCRVCPIDSFWDEFEEVVETANEDNYIRDYKGKIKISIEFLEEADNAV